jgi:hypothetical protein
MRMETGTFELRDNDMMMRALTDAEINEVAGGVGTAVATAVSISGAGSTQTVNGTANLATTNTSASASINSTSTSAGANNTIILQTIAQVV